MIVVTGAAGFIGSNIVASLNDSGRTDIVLCDWLSSDGRWLNLRKRMFRDFIFPEDLLARLDRDPPEAVIHMGASSSTTASDGDAVMRTNFQYTLRLIDWCARTQVPLVYASSAATYGDREKDFIDHFSWRELRTLLPLNLYGWSKHQIDLIVAERVEQGLPLPPRCIGLKFFNVYGPNEYHKGSMISVVGKNFESASRGEPVRLFKSHRNGFADGEQRRDFIHVDDVVSVVLWCLGNGPAHGLFNVGTGRASSFIEFVNVLFQAIGREPHVDFIEMPEALRDRYQYFTEASMGNLRAAGYDREFMNVSTGVQRYVQLLSAKDKYR